MRSNKFAAYNLGWKIAAVLKDQAHRSILKTYQTERYAIAQELIEFDRRYSHLFSGRPAKDIMDETGVSMEEFHDAIHTSHLFRSGLAVKYCSSVIVAGTGNSPHQAHCVCSSPGAKDSRVLGKQELTSNIKIGARMPSYQILNQADARP